MQNQNIIIGLYTNPRIFLVLVITTSVLKVGQTIADGRKWLKKKACQNSLLSFVVYFACYPCTKPGEMQKLVCLLMLVTNESIANM